MGGSSFRGWAPYLWGGVLPWGVGTLEGVGVVPTRRGWGGVAGGVVTARGTRRLKRLVADLKARRDPCWLCGDPIDYGADKDDPQSFQADHVKSWHDFPELREDPGNLRASHRGCNGAKGKGQAPLGLGVLAADW